MIGKFNIWELKISMSRYNAGIYFHLLFKNRHGNKHVQNTMLGLGLAVKVLASRSPGSICIIRILDTYNSLFFVKV
jgi:hypothetical protein